MRSRASRRSTSHGRRSETADQRLDRLIELELGAKRRVSSVQPAVRSVRMEEGHEPRDAFHHENPAICPFHHENPCWEKAHPAQTYAHYRLNQASAPTTVFSPRTHQYSAKNSRVFSAIPGVFSANSRKILGLFFFYVFHTQNRR